MASEKAFAFALARVLDFEGGYANDGADHGGETKYGISKRSYPDIDIPSLTEARATAIYRTDFWHNPRIDQLPDSVAGAVFDLGVNMGPQRAVRLLQEVLKSRGRAIVIDGVIGPATIKAACAVDGRALLATLRWRACLHYLALARAIPTQERFLSGWLRRACALDAPPEASPLT